jgi:hypothetical protein
MLTYKDLTSASSSDPSKSVAEVALARMRDTQKPMPPSQLATADQTSAFETWIAAGMPQGTCATAAPAPVANTPAVCTSKKTWTRGDHGSSSMHPGGACITCHTADNGPSYTIAGTLYPTAHEPDDCNGYGTGDTKISVTDATGRTITVTPNSAGNFYSRSSLKPPFKVQVVAGANVRAMNGTVTTGDCNSCHTEAGAQSAPGRIMVP